MCDHDASGQEIAGTGGARMVDLTRMRRRDLVRGLAAGSILVAASGCETNAVTGRSQFVAVDDTQLAAMALSAWQQELKDTPVSRDAGANARLQRIGRRIADVSALQGQQWEFVVFDKPEQNAFVLPGGKVGFYKGLMDIAAKDDHVAAVLGHEVGHVQGRHATERMSQQLAAQGALAAANLGLQDSRYRDIGIAALGLGAQIGIMLPFSRFQETEADRIGVDNMHRAGFDVREAVRFWEIMAANQSGGRQPAFLSTHPSPEARMADLRAYINQRGYARM